MHAGTGVGHIWLYSTKDWSCRRMEGGLMQPPQACCFCDWEPLSHPAAHLFVAPGPAAAAQCLPVSPSMIEVMICLYARRPSMPAKSLLCSIAAAVAVCSLQLPPSLSCLINAVAGWPASAALPGTPCLVLLLLWLVCVQLCYLVILQRCDVQNEVESFCQG